MAAAVVVLEEDEKNLDENFLKTKQKHIFLVFIIFKNSENYFVLFLFIFYNTNKFFIFIYKKNKTKTKKTKIKQLTNIHI